MDIWKLFRKNSGGERPTGGINWGQPSEFSVVNTSDVECEKCPHLHQTLASAQPTFPPGHCAHPCRTEPAWYPDCKATCPLKNYPQGGVHG